VRMPAILDDSRAMVTHRLGVQMDRRRTQD
jgi:hypothetical protein